MKLLYCLALIPTFACAAPNAVKPDQTARMMEENFKRVDSNKDGQLSREEARQRAPGLAKFFDEIDTDKNGQLSPAEVSKFMQSKRQEAVDNFKRADTDGNGALSKKEAESMPRLSNNFEAMDANHDGQLTPLEIAEYVRAQAVKNRAQKK